MPFVSLPVSRIVQKPTKLITMKAGNRLLALAKEAPWNFRSGAAPGYNV